MESRTICAWRSYLFLPFLLSVASTALLVRIGDIDYVAESLWTDDGFLFINQSYELGIRSLWSPYASYHLLYQRVIALLASQLPSIATPYIFFSAWLVSFFSVAWVLKNRGGIAGLNGQLIVYLVCAIALQPNIGNSFFFLSSAHFFLGIALVLHICTPSQRPASPPEILFLIFASLSGPFSALLAVVLVFQLAMLRDFSRRKATYIVVPICGLVQAISVLGSHRINHTALGAGALQWLQAISSLLFFGKSDTFTYLAAGMFWATALAFLLKWIADERRRSNRALWLSPLFAAVVTICLLLVTGLSAGSQVAELSPLTGDSARYFLIPYSLTFYIALVCTQDNRAGQMAVVSLIGMICASAFLPVARADRASNAGLYSHVNLQWAAYTKLQKIRSDLVIPINPPWPVYPPFWNAQLKRDDIAEDEPIKSGGAILLTPQQGVSILGSPDFRGTMSSSTGPTLYFDIKSHCVASSYLAMEVDIWRSRMGWARVSWGRRGDFDLSRSLERFYPSGSALMQFAFRRDASDYLIRLDPAEGVEDSPIMREWRTPGGLRWRESLSRHGRIVADLARPGGETRIKEVRLFCLE